MLEGNLAQCGQVFSSRVMSGIVEAAGIREVGIHQTQPIGLGVHQKDKPFFRSGHMLDACLAAVEHVAGSEERFVLLMNTKANGLGLVDTHFTNACGFDDPAHYTTAEDLATLSEIALQHPIFKTFVREESDVMYAVNGGRFYYLRNTNRLLGRLPGVEG